MTEYIKSGILMLEALQQVLFKWVTKRFIHQNSGRENKIHYKNFLQFKMKWSYQKYEYLLKIACTFKHLDWDNQNGYN